MSDNTTSVSADAADGQPVRPLGLSRRNDPAVTVMQRRLMPTAIPDDGIAPLDVSAFCSSI